MSKEKLSEILNNLRQELKRTELNDEEVKNKIDTLLEDLDNQLKNQDSPDIEDLTGKISKIIEQFEIEHPGITELLSKLSMGLSNMGI